MRAAAATLCLLACACRGDPSAPLVDDTDGSPGPAGVATGGPGGQETRPASRPASRPTSRGADTRPRRYTIRVGPRKLKVRLALTPEQRRQGLSGVRSLEPGTGMLFAYPRPRTVSFWMKGMLMDLDIAFIGKDRRIFKVATLAAPTAGTPDEEVADVSSGRTPAAFVLELPAGYLERHSLGAGTRVHLPRKLPLDEAR